VTLQRRFIWLSECDAEVQKCAENANGVCASGGSFLIQLDSEESVERKRFGSRYRRTRGKRRRGDRESKLDYWRIKTLIVITLQPRRWIEYLVGYGIQIQKRDHYYRVDLSTSW
jgi:hypothetical protein